MIERGLQHNSTDVIPRVESENRLNSHNSLEEFILEELGFSEIGDAIYTKRAPSISSNQIPLYAAKDIVVIDTLDTSIDNKLTLLGYKFWHKNVERDSGDYSLVKKMLPEGLVRIDDSVGDVLGDENLISMYEEAEITEELAENSTSGRGEQYLKRFKFSAFVVSRLLEYGFSAEEISSKSEKLLAYIKTLSDEENGLLINELMQEVEVLHEFGCVRKEMEHLLGLSESQLKININSLYYLKRIKPKKGWRKRNQKLINVTSEIEDLKINNPDMLLSEISEKLDVPGHVVASATSVLLNLGRIRESDRKLAKRRYHNTDEHERIIRETLLRYKDMYPFRIILIPELRELSGLDLPLKTIRTHYHNIAKNYAVPALKRGSVERAVQILEEFEGDSVPSSKELSAMTGMGTYTFTKARKILQARNGESI